MTRWPGLLLAAALIGGCGDGTGSATPTTAPNATPPDGMGRTIAQTQEDEAGYAIGPDEERQVTTSPDGQRRVTIVASGEGREILVSRNGGPDRSVGQGTIEALFEASDLEGDGCHLGGVSIVTVAWEGPRTLRLELACWAAGREAPPTVVVSLDVDAGTVGAAR